MRPYFQDFAVHAFRFYLARKEDIDPVPLEKLDECSRQNYFAAEKTFEELNPIQLDFIRECYGPLIPYSMFKVQFNGVCKRLGFTENSAYLELRDAFYRFAMYRGLIDKPYKHYRLLHQRTGKRVDQTKDSGNK